MGFVEHSFKAGDKVRVTNVASHMYGPRNFNEGDVATIISAEPLMGFIPGVLVAPTSDTAQEEAVFGGVPFAGEDLKMLTLVEEA